MKIAIIGYGKMGKEIEKIALTRGHQIVLKVDKDTLQDLSIKDYQNADVAIEFSTPDSVLSNIRTCFEANLPIVVGTTGWYEHFESIKKECLETNKSFFYATNYSLGVNLFFKLNTYLAEMMNKYTDYNVCMEEIHHIHKLDKPSGTAITLAEQIIEKLDRKKNWSLDKSKSDSLFIQDVREGEVPGTHSIKYQSSIDDIEIKHVAHNRQGFALGSIVAAEFLVGKKGIYNMQDIV